MTLENTFFSDTMVTYEIFFSNFLEIANRNFFKLYFQNSGNNQYIYQKINSVQLDLFVVTDRSKLWFDFLNMFGDGLNIDGFCKK